MSMGEIVGDDLNRTIAAAVSAKIEATVMHAFASDDVLGRFVTAALQQPVERPDARDRYGKVKVPYVHAVLNDAIQAATKAAVQRIVAEQADALQTAIEKALVADKKNIAAMLVASLKAESNRYISVSLSIKGGGE